MCECLVSGLPVLSSLFNHGRPLITDVSLSVPCLCILTPRLRADGRPDAERQSAQRACCPRFVPRQHLLQWAIDAAEAGDYSELEALVEVLERCEGPGRGVRRCCAAGTTAYPGALTP